MDWTELSVKDLMQTSVKIVSETKPLLTAARMMHDDGLSSLVVEPKNQQDALGILTRKDIVEALFFMEIDDSPLLVNDVMTKPVVTVLPDLSVHQCHQLMRMIGVRRIPVVEGKKLVGILSTTDIFRSMVGEID